jgi:hypothetical protein
MKSSKSSDDDSVKGTKSPKSASLKTKSPKSV